MLVATVAGLSACKKKSTFVHVQILPAAGGEPAAITEIELQLDLAGKQQTVRLSEPGNAPMQLPTDVTLEVKSGSGQLAITAIARNAAGQEVDRAVTTVQVSSGAIAQAAVQLPGGKPDLQPVEASHAFGTVPQGDQATPVNLGFRNVGFRPSGAMTATLGGVGASAWIKGADTCTGSTLAPGATCAVSLQFNPNATGALAATLTVSATPGGSAAVALTGTGAASVTITVTIGGAGSGAIADDRGHSCTTATSPCTFFEPLNGTVTLTATADAGSAGVIVGQPPACTSNTIDSCTFDPLTASQAVTMDFVPNVLTVATAGAPGTVNSADGKIVDCSSAPSGTCTATYNWKDPVSLEAIARPGTSFASWTGDVGACAGAPDVSPCALTMNRPQSLTANFDYNLALALAGTGTGSVTCSTDGGGSFGPCAAHYPPGTNLTLQATADPATSRFDGWSGDCAGTALCTVTMDVEHAVTATFTTFTVTVTKAVDTGTVTSTDGRLVCDAACTTASVQYPPGSSITLATTPAAGLLLIGYQGCTWDNRVSCTIASLAGDTTVTPGFNPSLCSGSVAYGQVFNASMQGCPGSVTFSNRASLCGAGSHVCNAGDWVANNGGTAPAHHYYTDDDLRFSSGTGVCGSGGCNTNSCWVGSGGAYTGTCSGTTGPMRVCAGNTSGSRDPEGNVCNITSCGYNTNKPDQHFGGCGSLSAPNAGALCCSDATVHLHFVNAASANTTGPCTSTSPCKTITTALGLAGPGDTIRVAAGAYNAANGETFPMVVPAGVNLIGDELTRGAGPAGGPAAPTTIAGTVRMSGQSTLAGFTITSAGNGIIVNTADVTVRNNTVTGGNTPFAIDVSGSTNHQLLLNAIVNNASATRGIFTSSPATGKVENNTITGNRFAVEYDTAGGDLGGGAAGSVGNNIFSCNRDTDLWVNSGLAVTASSNQWDHALPLADPGAFGNGMDYFANAASTITSINTGARQAAGACLPPCANAASAQIFDASMVGCIAQGSPAAITFTNRTAMCPAGCHSCSAAEWNTHRGGAVPVRDFWTGDLLNWNGSSTGNGCQVSVSAVAPFFQPCGAGASMLVCPDTGGFCQSGALMCGLNTTVNQHFGGCASSSGTFTQASGTLCCCP